VVGDGKWLSVKEAVERFEGLFGEQKVRRLCDEGELESIRLKGSRGDRRIKAESVDRYLAHLKGSSDPSDRAAPESDHEQQEPPIDHDT
jgi:excisionase family DNA binding protein